MSWTSLSTTLLLSTLLGARVALGFCGFYVAKADTQLFNKASKVALVRHDNKTVMTMANDYRGDPQEFALVVPVPTFLERDQIHVGEPAPLDHLDAYSAPRLVEYFDTNPCPPPPPPVGFEPPPPVPRAVAPPGFNQSLGVTVEARYTVGEYDIVILSAEQSTGLTKWLTNNGYRIPPGATRVLGSYIKQGMRFFVAKVNLQTQAQLGFTYLRPLQIAYASPKFMLPIRLGTVNADGPQDLYVFALTRKGRVETTNYQTIQLPTGLTLPVFIKGEFGAFYRALFDRQVQWHHMQTVFVEYAWDMGSCDPCAATPLSTDELRQLGVFWLATAGPTPLPRFGGFFAPQGQDVVLTRLHVRYDADHFPEDLMFQETGDRTNFQSRYVVRHPWEGTEMCREAETYRAALPQRWAQEAQSLAALTGWPVEDIRKKMPGNGTATAPQQP